MMIQYASFFLFDIDKRGKTSKNQTIIMLLSSFWAFEVRMPIEGWERKLWSRSLGSHTVIRLFVVLSVQPKHMAFSRESKYRFQ